MARTAGVDRKVARFQLEELAAIGVVTNDRVDDDEEEPTGPVTWILDGADGALSAVTVKSKDASTTIEADRLLTLDPDRYQVAFPDLILAG